MQMFIIFFYKRKGCLEEYLYFFVFYERNTSCLSSLSLSCRVLIRGLVVDYTNPFFQSGALSLAKWSTISFLIPLFKFGYISLKSSLLIYCDAKQHIFWLPLHIPKVLNHLNRFSPILSSKGATFSFYMCKYFLFYHLYVWAFSFD